MYLPVGNCLRNLQFIIRRSRSFDQSTRSASVDCLLICLALDICDITLTPVSWYGAGSNPLPEGEGACWLVLMLVCTLLPTLVSPSRGEVFTLTPVSWYGAGSNPHPEGEGACWLVLMLVCTRLPTPVSPSRGEVFTLTPVSWYGAGSNPLPEGEGACWLVLMLVCTRLPTLVSPSRG